MRAQELPGPRKRPQIKENFGLLSQEVRKYSILEQDTRKLQQSGQERAWRKDQEIMERFRFGNRKMADPAELRGKVTYYTSLMTLSLIMNATGPTWRV